MAMLCVRGLRKQLCARSFGRRQPRDPEHHEYHPVEHVEHAPTLQDDLGALNVDDIEADALVDP